jgi:uncharacterized protein
MNKNLIILSFIAIAFLAGCANVTEKPNAEYKPNYKTPPFIIDSHIHYKASDAWEKAFIDTFTKYNAMGCVLVDMQYLDRGIAFAKAHPDRVIPYAAVKIDSSSVLKDIQRAYDMGYKGLGELFATGDWNYNDPRYEPIWTLAEKLGLPIAPHTGNLATGQMDHLRPAPLADIAAKHKNLLIHAAHFGNPWYEEAAEAARRNKNLYFDLSGSSLIKKENDPGYWAQWLWWTDAIGKAHMPKNADPAWQKIVFASDEGPDQLRENIRRFNKMLDACKVPDSTRVYCYGLTIAKMHGIKVPVAK